METKLYFAYGANTNKRSMAVRCPNAHPIGSMRLTDARLAFRGVADVEPAKGSVVFGALWEITPECEDALDRFEGYPWHYTKRTVMVNYKGVDRPVMFYTMQQRSGVSAPGLSYEQTLREGYRDFGLPESQIDIAIHHANRTRGKEMMHKKSQWDLLDLDEAGAAA
jgi:gamma-glutamylcyclotransferase (GGCT)/AIG2-like uncharacterized protein YtfP